MSEAPSGVAIWSSRHAPLRCFGLAVLAAALFLAIASAPAHAAREFDCQIGGLATPAEGECNGAGNVLPPNVFYARSVAVDGGGNIWVSDELPNVFKFDPSGTFLTLNDGSTTWGGGGITDLAFGQAAGLVYGSEAAGGAIWKISPDASSPGQIVTNTPGGGNIAVDNSGGSHGGDVYIEEGGSVSRYKPDGSPDEFEAGRAVHLDAGLPYLSGNHITGTPEFPTTLYTRDIAVDPDGNIYVLLSNPTTFQAELVRYDSSGTFDRSYSGAFIASGSAGKLAIDPTSGNLLIFDEYGPEGQTLWEVDSSGEVLAQITGASTNTPGGTLGGEAQLSIDQSGRILYTGNNTVHIIGPADPLPRISYGAETGLTRSSVDVHATVDPNGAGDITNCEVQYGTTIAYGTSIPCVPSPSPKFSAPTAIEAHLAIHPGSSFHYRVVVENADGVRRGDDRTFSLPAVEDVTTGDVTDVTKESATVNGSFSDDGTPAKYYFEYGPTKLLGKRFPLLPGSDTGGGSGTVPLSATLSNLEPRTLYYYRLVVATSFGASHGLLESFETLSGPTIESFSAEEVNDTSAKLIGRIDPNGFATSAHFDYGPTPDYGQTVAIPAEQLESVSGVQSVFVQLQGLESGVTYHFRLTAESAQGTVVSEDQSFTFFPPNCPNSQVRLETGSSYLPDCRAYELVSPGDAGGILLAWDAPQSAAATNPPRFAFAGIFGTLPGQGLPSNVQGDLYVAERTGTGWKTSYVGLPSNVALEQGGPPRRAAVGRPGSWPTPR